MLVKIIPMKTLIIALNSKYIHSALAPWYLKAACGDECGEVLVSEHTINENIDSVLSDIYLKKPDVAAFSCYIWNIGHVLKLAGSLKKLIPGIVTILGGPEVSYDAAGMLKKYDFIDYVVMGEGEKAFPLLLKHLNPLLTKGSRDFAAGQALIKPEQAIDGIAWREGNDIIAGLPSIIESLDSIPSPYSETMLKTLKNKIAYFETSRGCQFNCSYCLSSAVEGVRYFSLDRVFFDLEKLVSSGVKQIKFVDRTFNFNRKRAMQIIEHIIEKYFNSGCNFHFEVGADLFDEELINLLGRAPKGLIQFEAGVQSTNRDSLAEVCRNTNIERLIKNLKIFREMGNIHIHADLIAGLPREDFNSFRKSFNDLYNARPHQLQLGFLKFLKGTMLRENAGRYGYEYNSFAPYEILSGKWISYDELIILKGIAEIIERYYNSGRFAVSIEYLIREYFQTPFDFYEGFYLFHKKNGYLDINIGLRDLYVLLDNYSAEFISEIDRKILRQLMKLDFLSSDNSGRLPEFLSGKADSGFNDLCFEFLKNSENIKRFLPLYTGMPAKQIFKSVHFEKFDIDVLDKDGYKKDGQKATVLLFDYMARDKVTGRYTFHKVEL